MEERPKSSYSKKNSANFSKQKVNGNYSLKKRPLSKNFYRENTVYVTNRSDIKTLMKKCEKYFSNNINEISIYCAGAAIERGINLALQISNQDPSAKLSVNTSSITITDDLEPLVDDLDYETQNRENSVVHIRVIKPNTVDILNSGQN